MTKAEIRQQNLDEVLRQLLETAEGRRFMHELLHGRCNVGRLSFISDGPGSTHATAYLEGRRSIGLELAQDCERVARANYVHMLDEASRVREEERLLAHAEKLDGG